MKPCSCHVPQCLGDVRDSVLGFLHGFLTVSEVIFFFYPTALALISHCVFIFIVRTSPAFLSCLVFVFELGACLIADGLGTCYLGALSQASVSILLECACYSSSAFSLCCFSAVWVLSPLPILDSLV